MKRNTWLLLAGLCATLFAGAQTTTLDGFTSINRKSISPIVHENEVKGYALFYRADKADRKNDNYGIDIYDEELNQVKNISFQKPRGKFFLLENAYNGQAMGFLFYNSKDKSFELETYDMELKKLGSKKIEDISKGEQAMIAQMMAGGEENLATPFLSLFPVAQKGFVRNGVEGKGQGFTLEMLDNDLNSKWTYASDPESKDYEAFMISSVTEEYVVGCIIRRPSFMSKKLTYYIGIFDVNTGEKIIDQPVEDENAKEELSITTVTYLKNKKGFLVSGDYYKPGSKPGVKRSEGFFLKFYSVDGEQTEKKLYAWNKEMKKILPAKANASLEKGYMNYSHRLIVGADGKIYAINEQFRKAVDGWGVASNVVNHSYTSNMQKAVVGNMLIFVFDSDLNLTGSEFVEKDPSDVILPPGADFWGAGLIGMMVKSYGDFDYQFTQSTNANDAFHTVYINYDRVKGEGTKKIVGTVSLGADGKFTADRIDVTSKATSSFIFPAKPGYIMMVDYLKKQKQLGLKLIKINS